MPDSAASLVDGFKTYFSVQLALGEETRRHCHHVRYRVYCEDMDFEPAARFPDQLERDTFDSEARHCLVLHRASGLPAACLRVVAASEEQRLPFEEHCLPSVYTGHAGLLESNRQGLCEISRMAVDRHFRRRAGESRSILGHTAHPGPSSDERRSFALLAAVTTLAGFAAAELDGREHIFAMMEPRLARLMRSYGFPMEQAGVPWEYHGERVLYHTEPGLLLDSLRGDLAALFDHIRSGFRDQLSAARQVA